MKKLILFSLISGIILLSCGEESTSADKDAPHIKSMTSDNIGVEDDFSITFSEEIDTSKLVIKEINGRFKTAFNGTTKLIISGHKSEFGFDFFKLNTPIEFQLLHLIDINGNENNDLDPISIVFHPWMDQEALDPLFELGDTLRDSSDPSAWKNGISISEDLTSEGHLFGLSNNDFVDYKVIALRPRDTIQFNLECPETGKVFLKFFGPFKTDNFENNFAEVRNPVTSDSPLFLEEGNCDKTKDYKSSKIKILYIPHDNAIGGDGYGFYVARVYLKELIDENFGFYQLTATIWPR